MGLEFGILGPLRVLADGEHVPLPGERLRTLLGLLLVRTNRLVPTETIHEALWDESRSTDPNTIQVYVSRLRRALTVGGSTPPLETREGRYVLRTDDNLDAVRFEESVEMARGNLLSGDVQVAPELLGQGLSLWRGRVLEDLPDRTLFNQEGTRLELMRLAAEGDWVETQLNLGKHTEVVDVARGFTDAEPLRERRWVQLTLALYRCGRQAEALRMLKWNDSRLRGANDSGQANPGRY